MKYLINHRFQTILSIKNQTEKLLATCHAGRSEELMPSIENLRASLLLLPPMKSEPFSKKQISTLEKLEKEADKLLSLPENFAKVAKNALEHCEKLLKEIEPFILEEGNIVEGEDPSIIYEMEQIKTSIEHILVNLEGKATAVANHLEEIKSRLASLNILSDSIEKDRYKKVVKEFIEIWDLYDDSWGMLEFQMLHQSCEYVIRFLKHGEEISEDELALVAILQNLEEVYKKAKPLMKEKNGNFMPLFQDAYLEKQVKMLEDFEFEDEDLTKMRDTITVAYTQGVKENGRSEASRSKAVECFGLFGETVSKLLKAFNS